MLIHLQFLWSHVDILLASVILVIVVKTTVSALITKAFGYGVKTLFLVGIMLAQIGESAFVLLSCELPRDIKAYNASRVSVSKANDEVDAFLDDSDKSCAGSDVEDFLDYFAINANLPDASEDVQPVNNLQEDEYFTKHPQDNRLVATKPRERRPFG